LSSAGNIHATSAPITKPLYMLIRWLVPRTDNARHICRRSGQKLPPECGRLPPSDPLHSDTSSQWGSLDRVSIVQYTILGSNWCGPSCPVILSSLASCRVLSCSISPSITINRSKHGYIVPVFYWTVTIVFNILVRKISAQLSLLSFCSSAVALQGMQALVLLRQRCRSARN